jgi:hypothetical protein
MKRAAALYLYLSYKLETHYWLQVSLKNWLWLVVVGPPVLAWLQKMSWMVALLASTAGALLLAGTQWAKSKHYTIFTPDGTVSMASQTPTPIQVDEQIRCRAFGQFAVEAKERFVVNEDAQISFVRTREHIVMAYVRRTRFLLLATSLKKDVGWWYVFVMPDRLQEVRLGTLYCGFTSQTALALFYRPEKEPDRVHELYLAFKDAETRQRVLDDLRRDAPATAPVQQID